MAIQDELTHSTTAQFADGSNRPASWQSRSTDELRAIVHRGILGGEAFFAAAAEMERRAREMEAARDVQQVQAVKTSRRLGWELKVLFVVLAVAALILLLR